MILLLTDQVVLNRDPRFKTYSPVWHPTYTCSLKYQTEFWLMEKKNLDAFHLFEKHFP